MLDAWIIDRLKQDREERQERPALRLPLHPVPRPQEQREDNTDERGSTVIDYTV